MKVVHLPVYEENAYQGLLMEAQRELGIETIGGGGGGDFFRTALREWRADVLHFHWIHPYLLRSTRLGSLVRSFRLILELRALRAAGQRIVWTVHNLRNHANHQPALERWWTRRFVRQVSAVITHSDYARAQAAIAFNLTDRDRDRVFIIPHGNYIGHYPNTISTLEARKRLNIPADAFVFLFLGRIEPYKGLDELFEAFGRLDQDVFLLIAGRVAHPDALVPLKKGAGVNPRVRIYPEYIPSEHLQEFFNASDVAVLPFRDILTSGSAILAMSFARTFVAPGSGSLSEACPEGGALFYNPEHDEGLLGAMREAIRRRSELAEMGNRCFQRVSEWTWHRVGKRTLEIYEIARSGQSITK